MNLRLVQSSAYGWPMKPAANASLVGAHPTTRARVGYLVYRVERRVRTRLDEVTRDHGVTTTEYVALSVLRDRDGMSSAELARWAFVTPQAMNLVISALERRRLVRRRPDPQHRRVLRASVTAKGRQVLEGCDRSMDQIEGEMLQDLAPEEIDELRTALASCAHALETARPRLA
jgi:DNA-binding MarR family transcriptional regulator